MDECIYLQHRGAFAVRRLGRRVCVAAMALACFCWRRRVLHHIDAQLQL